MTDANEPSYYEVALTNRQVLVSFVVLLGCILMAFVFGVWVGKEGSDPAAQELASEPMAPQEMAKLEELEFFHQPDDGESSPSAEPLDKPDLSRLARQPDSKSTLAEDVGSAAATDPSPASPPPPASAPPPPRQATQAAPPPAAAKPAPASGPTAPSEGFIVQVFSSHDRVQAQKVLDQMQQGGYRAFVSPKHTGGQTMYRVRLGPYDQKPPAEAAASDVTRQYKLETWVTAASN